MDVIHVHGFSQKNLPVALMGRLRGKPVVLTLHTAGQDEPQAARRRGSLATWAFTSPQLTLAVSPNLIRRCREGRLRADRIRQVQNGVDTATSPGRAGRWRCHELRWPGASRSFFVGFFSRDKRPDLLFAPGVAVTSGMPATLVYIGATASPHCGSIRRSPRRFATARPNWDARTGCCLSIHARDGQLYLPRGRSVRLVVVREANPVALLERVVRPPASRRVWTAPPTSNERRQRRLVAPDDEQALAAALAAALGDPVGRSGLKGRARPSSPATIFATQPSVVGSYRTVLGGITRRTQRPHYGRGVVQPLGLPSETRQIR
jgi:hypothetical protein